MPNRGSTLTVPLNVIGDDFQSLDRCLLFLAHVPDDGFQAGFDGLNQRPPPTIRTLKHLVAARVTDVPGACVGLDHMF
jgi:hypothetical protein